MTTPTPTPPLPEVKAALLTALALLENYHAGMSDATMALMPKDAAEATAISASQTTLLDILASDFAIAIDADKQSIISGLRTRVEGFVFNTDDSNEEN